MHGLDPRLVTIPVGIAALLVGPGPAATQPLGERVSGTYLHAEAPRVTAGRASSPITIDARLDDPAWEGAEPATGFVQRDPREGAPATERTEVRILLGDGALYVGARMYDGDPSGIRGRMSRRDGPPDFDWFLIYLDPFHDHLRAVWFSLNPAGSKADAVRTGRGTDDLTWDPVWEGETRVDERGWVAEMRIPLSQIRYDPDLETWGVQLMRFVHRKQELAWWAFTPKDEPEGPSRFGHLTGLVDLGSGTGLEVTPNVSLRTARAARFAGPNEEGFTPRAGVDLKFRPGTSWTIDATVNPDFGQVEVDPAVVNLTAFETFYPERRTFFVEGAAIFEFAGLEAYNVGAEHDVFYSRRIGRPPQGSIGGEASASSDLPGETTIAAAAKLTGRSASGWSIGILDAWTLAERVRVTESAGEARSVTLEPPTNYAVGRVRRDFRDGASTLGGIVTGVDRHLGDTGLGSVLPERARVIGIDFAHTWSGREWTVSGFAARSRVTGSAEAIATVQRSSARYFDRPDAGHVDFDPSRTALEGSTWQVAVERSSGEHWLGSVAFQAMSPGYETNDVGFLSITDRRMASWLVRYREERPGRWWRRWDLVASGNHNWNFDGDLVGHRLGLAGSMELPGYASLHMAVRRDFERFHDRLTRGGPLARAPAGFAIDGGYHSDVRASHTWSVHGAFASDDGGSRSSALEGRFVLRPSPASRIEIGPRVERVRDVSQFVTAVEDPTAVRALGTRTVFATLDQTTASIDARVRWGFTPTLGLEGYAQLLLAGHDYGSFKEFREPGRYAFDVYGRDRGTIAQRGDDAFEVDPDGPGAPAPPFSIDDPAFGTRSLRGNLVLRWEFRPGSTLWAVYQHGRERVDDATDVDPLRDLDHLFAEPGSDVLVVKASWWLDL